MFSSVRWSYKPSFKKFLGANFELNDLIVNFVPFLPIFGISLLLKREVQKLSYSYFTEVFSSVRWSYKPSFKKFLGANFELNDLIVNFVPFLPIFGISLRLKREVQKFSYSYFTVVLNEAINQVLKIPWSQFWIKRLNSQFCTIFTDFWYFLAFKKRSSKILILILYSSVQ